jgi:nucleotide-binding universal stress UspA family protein
VDFLMYRRILVPLEHTDTDRTILAHVRDLARVCGSSLVLIHVADGWAARNAARFELRESEEMRADREYLEQLAEELEAEGFEAEAVLAGGDPAAEIAAAATREKCDLIAMSTHGHKLLSDLVLGSVANEVRHQSLVPVLLVRKAAATKGSPRDTSAQSGRSR